MLRACRCSLRDNVAGGERDAGKEGQKRGRKKGWMEGGKDARKKGRAGMIERRIGSF